VSKSKIVLCIDCGREFPRKELNRKFRCPDCRTKIVEENMRQLMAHEGPHYKKWQRSMEEMTQKFAAR